MVLNKSTIKEIISSLKECNGFFMYFNRNDPDDLLKYETRRIINIEESLLFDMIIQLFNDDKGKLLDRFLSYSEGKLKKIEQNTEENCGPLTEREIEVMYNIMIEKDKKNESLAEKRQ